MADIDERALPVLVLLELRNVEEAIVNEKEELASEYIRLWESRGFTITNRVGTIRIAFSKPLQYIYPLNISL